MHRTLRWLAAIFLAGCLVLGYLAAHQGAELNQAAAERSTAEKEAQKRMGDLQRQLAAVNDQALIGSV